jgi:hypothetical protein
LRISATDGPILILQDTTEFSFKRADPQEVGFTHVSTGRKIKDGRYQKHAVSGLLMHASLAITPEGLPLGLTAAKFWSRSKFKGTRALKRKINPTRVPIEQKESMRWLDNLRLSTELASAPERCVHIGDRESDVYELYCLAEDLGTGFLVRSCVDRLAENGDTTIGKSDGAGAIQRHPRDPVPRRAGESPSRGPIDPSRFDDDSPADRKAKEICTLGPSDHLCRRA